MIEFARNINSNIEAMKASGQKDDVIIDRLIKSSIVEDRVKNALKQAKSMGLTTRAISDLQTKTKQA